MFNVLTPLGFYVRCTKEWWEYVSTVKHPVLEGRVEAITRVKSTLPNKLAAAPQPSECSMRVPGPSGSRFNGSDSLNLFLTLRCVLLEQSWQTYWNSQALIAT
jgi:hypothetical protein